MRHVGGEKMSEDKAIKDLKELLLDIVEKRKVCLKILKNELPPIQVQYNILDTNYENLRITAAIQLQNFGLMKKASKVTKRAENVAWVSLIASAMSVVLSISIYL